MLPENPVVVGHEEEASTSPDVPPSLLYRNMVARNTREPRRIWLEPPDASTPTPTTERPVASLYIVPCYEAPCSPLVCWQPGARHLAVVALGPTGSATPTERQLQALGLQQQPEGMVLHLSQYVAQGEASACRALLLVAQLLQAVQAPTSVSQLQAILQQLSAATGESNRERQARLCRARFDVLDSAWLAAIKWVRLRRPREPHEAQLTEARTLYHRVREAYSQADTHEHQLLLTERTLRNVLDDLRACLLLQ